MQRTQLFALLAVFFAAVGLNAQAIIHVPSDQPSIQAAINAAGNGDTVLVAPGIYFENIDFLGRAITLQSQSGAAVTTINGQGLGPVVMIHSGESASTVLQGFTITNGSANFASQYSGGGIYISNASPSILNNVISGNYTCDSGGGIFSGSGSPLIQGNTITNNSQTGCSGGNGGGGIAIVGFNGIPAQIIGNIISNNSHGSWGGGLSLNGAGVAIVSGNTISGNHGGPQGGGGIVSFNNTSPQIVNNLVYGNTALTGGGVYLSGPPSSAIAYGTISIVNNTIAANDGAQGSAFALVVYKDQSQSTLTNNLLIAKPGQPALQCTANIVGSVLPAIAHNDVYALSAANYSGNCSDLTGTNGNISADPIFIDTSNNNYRLSLGSPAINAGTNDAAGLPSLDIAGNPRIADDYNNGSAVVDLGAYEMPPLPPAPGLVPSASALDFGTVTLGLTSAVQTLTLTNIGPGGLFIGAAGTAAPFAVSSNNCVSTVAPGQSCTIGLTFSPLSAGAASGSLTLSSNAGNTPLVVSLTGSGAAQTFSLSSSALAFGDVWLGSSASQQLLVTNIAASAAPVVVASDSVAFTWSSSCPASLAPSKSCTVTVTFRPSSLTSFSGNLTISDNANSRQIVSLSGNGIGAVFHVYPGSSYTFTGNYQIGGTGFQYFNIANYGNAPLTLSSIGISPGQFSIASNSCGASLAPGDYCSIQVLFTAAVLGTASGTVTMVDNAPGSPHTISLTATVVGSPGISVAPNPVFFGNVLVGSGSQVNVMITSSGTGSLKLYGISLSGPFSTSGNCAYITLASQSTCTLTLTFAPTVAGQASGTLTIYDNVPGSPQIINISGNGVVEPRTGLSVSNGGAFGSIILGSSGTAALTITNTGNAALALGNVAATGPFSVSGTCPVSLAPQSSCTLTLGFTPTALGPATGSVTVTDNAPGSPHSVALSGVGTDFVMSASPASQTVAAGKSVTYTVVLAPRGGFTGVVQLGCLGAPAGVSCAVPPSVAVNGGVNPTFSATLTANKGLKTRGTYPITITGSVSGVQRSVSVLLTTKP